MTLKTCPSNILQPEVDWAGENPSARPQAMRGYIHKWDGFFANVQGKKTFKSSDSSGRQKTNQ